MFLDMVMFHEDVLFIYILLVKHRSLCLAGRYKMCLFTFTLLDLVYLKNFYYRLGGKC